MHRLFLICSLGCLICLMLQSPVATYACTLVQSPYETAAQASEVIAIGRVTEADEHVATIEVETYLKGAVTTPTLTVINHYGGVDTSCETRLKRGGRFAVGDRLVMFLVAHESAFEADWQPFGATYESVWMIKDNRVTLPEKQATSFALNKAIKLIQAQTGIEPFVPQAPVFPWLFMSGGIVFVAGVITFIRWHRSRHPA